MTNDELRGCCINVVKIIGSKSLTILYE